MDALADVVVPGIPATQFALIQPDGHARGTQGRADPLRRRGILGRVADEYRRVQSGAAPGFGFISRLRC